MKQDAWDSLPRLRDRPPGGEAPEDRAAALLRGMQPCDEASALQMAQIEEAIGARFSRPPRPSLTLRMALAVVALFAGVATVKAYELARQAGWLDRSRGVVLPPEARPLPSKRLARAPHAALLQPTAPLLDQAPIALVPGAPEPPDRSDRILAPETVASEPLRRQARATRRVTQVENPTASPASAGVRRDAFEPAPTMPAPTTPGLAASGPLSLPAHKSSTLSAPASTPAQEIHALDGAIALLRRDHDATAALTALDTYLDRYPHGVLHREARLARLDALLILKRTDQALAELETLPLDSGRRSTELQVVRAELRARTNCLRAEEDFSAALTHSPDAALLERILYGRGECRAKSRNVSGAAEDLRRYIERFPNGAHAHWARHWLDTIGTSPVEGG